MAVVRIGWAYLWPCMLAGIALAFTSLGVFLLLYKMPRMWMEAVALWMYWVLVLYLGMVSIRMMGLTYHATLPDLAWFKHRPQVGHHAASWSALLQTPEPASGRTPRCSWALNWLSADRSRSF